MPKYWGKQISPEMGRKQKTERKERERKERLNDGNNNGQLRIANHLRWRTQSRLGQNFQLTNFSNNQLLKYFQAK